MTAEQEKQLLHDLQRLADAVSTLCTHVIANTMDRPSAPASKSSGAPRSNGSLPVGALPTTLPNYGRAKGAPITGADRKDLEYYAARSRDTLNNPEKSRWHVAERALLEAIDAEIARQAGAPAAMNPPDDFGTPPPGFDEPAQMAMPSDDDIPF